MTNIAEETVIRTTATLVINAIRREGNEAKSNYKKFIREYLKNKNIAVIAPKGPIKLKILK